MFEDAGAWCVRVFSMKRVGIYVQVPFCQTRCTYCNFHTGVVAAERYGPYVEAVCGEIRGHEELYRAAGVEWGERSGEWRVASDEKRRERELARSSRSAQRAQRRDDLPGTSAASGYESGESIDSEFVVDTVYIGGGTPSLLEARHLGEMLGAIRETFVVEGRGERSSGKEEFGGELRVKEEGPGRRTGSGQAECGHCSVEKEKEKAPASEGGRYGVEVTLEADPETVEEEKAAGWVAAGINRVSFGAQSFVDAELVAAGRMHRRADIYRAAAILRAAGIGNISFDLIAGLPHQTKESWRESLEELRRLEPEHVSVYLLEIDEGSRLGKEALGGGARYSARALPAEDEMAEFYEEAQRVLGVAGYHHYEISNWGKPGYESRHNLKYWRREAYLGFGAGAHSFSGKQRWANVHDAAEYVRAMEREESPLKMAGRAGAIEQVETIGREQALEEELFLGLRQLDGIDVGRIEREYGVELGEKLGRLEMAGFVERCGNVVRLAGAKLSVANEVFVEMMR